MFEGEYSRPSPPIAWPAIFGRVLGGLGGILWPSDLGDGELTPEQQREGRERYEASEEAKADAQRAEELSRAMRELEAARAEAWPGRYHRGQDVADMPEPFQFEAPQPVLTPSWPSPAPAPIPPPAPVPHGAPSPSSSPTPSRSSAPQPTQARLPQPSPNAFNWPLWELVASAVAGQLFNPSARSGWTLPRPSAGPSAAVDPLSPPWPSTAVDPLTGGNPLTGLGTSALGSSPPFTPSTTATAEEDQCRCKKPRKKKRACRGRAGLRWVGGPKSGQMAGSRCYSFSKGD